MDISTEVLLESTDTATTIPYGITEEELENWTPEEYGPFALAILSTKSFEDGSTSQVVAFGSAYRSAIRCFPAGRSATRITTFRCSTP